MARRKQAFISLISLISILGVTLGVMALVVALALMTGMQQELRDRITGSEAHVYVWDIGGGGFENYREEARRLAEFPRVLGAAPSDAGEGPGNHTERRGIHLDQRDRPRVGTACDRSSELGAAG